MQMTTMRLLASWGERPGENRTFAMPDMILDRLPLKLLLPILHTSHSTQKADQPGQENLAADALKETVLSVNNFGNKKNDQKRCTRMGTLTS